MTSRRPGSRRLALVGLLVLSVASRAAAQGGLSLGLEPVTFGLSRPLAVTHAGDDSGRLFIVEQTGRIRVWDGARLLAAPFLDLSALIACCGERGLLGLAFDPDYEVNGRFYVGYSDSLGDTVIARYTVSAGDPDLADPASALTLLHQPQPAANHNNGHLAFGPDGYLYIGMGDGGAGSAARGQDLTSLLGKVLRVDPDGDDFPADPQRNYAVPADNPFVGVAGVRDEIWAYGVRNPWRFSFDRQLGDLWIGDVGAATLEEIDFQTAASPGGENYGWSLMEGTSCFAPPVGCNDGSLTLPVLEYDHDFGCAVTGGYRYRGRREPRLRGVYLFGDFCSGTIWGTVPRCDGVWESQELLSSGLTITSFGEDEEGEVYISDLHGNGGVYRLTTSGAGGPALDASASVLDFGAVTPGTPVSLPLTLSNTNAGPEAVVLDALAASDPAAFAVDLTAGAEPCGPLPICLAPGDSCSLEVELDSLGGSFDERLPLRGNFAEVQIDLLATVPCGGPDHAQVDQAVVSFTREVVGCRTATLGPDLELAAGAIVVARAGRTVRLTDLAVSPGAALRIENDASLLP